MQIIPVIDLMQGQVVHAKRGQRGQYLPVKSCLCTGSEPLDILQGLLKLYPFDVIYIADIDAIMRTGNHDTIIETLASRYPHITFWLDAGIGSFNAETTNLRRNIRPVIGSESVKTLQAYCQINGTCNSRQVLSLDFDARHAMGITELHTKAELWPEDVVCMTLNAVGKQQGFDSQRLNQLIALNHTREFPANLYAAGGIRDMSDIRQLLNLNIKGALVATALHQGEISSSELKQLDVS